MFVCDGSAHCSGMGASIEPCHEKCALANDASLSLIGGELVLIHARLLSNGRVAQNTLKGLEGRLAEVFPNSRIILDGQAIHPPSGCFNRSRGQYNSILILQSLSNSVKRRDDERILAVESEDLYVCHLNFVFGEADPSSRIAVVSTYRLRPEFYGETPSPTLLFSRLVKECIHELGHLFGLGHCPTPTCVMHFSNSILETDLKGPDFCPRCKFNLEERLRKDQYV